MSKAPVAVRVQRELEEMAQGDPIWKTWIALTELIDESSRDPVWAGTRLDLAHRSSTAPLLDSATVTIEPDIVKDWYRRLFATAVSSDPDISLKTLASHPEFDAADTLAAVMNQDAERIRHQAERFEVDADLFATLVDLSARPLLLTWSRLLANDVPATWPHGYCPVCGAWPAVAELRGLDRARWLRCLRCASEWRFVALRCPYCGTTNHEHLGSLYSPDEAESRKVDVCNHCRGYVKTVATLRPLSAHDITLIDLGTVDLDVAALDRDYARPVAPATRLNLQVVARDG